MTEQVMTDKERTALQLSRVMRVLEKAWPLIEEEAERRDAAFTNGGAPLGPYFTEMRELADEIAAEIHLNNGGRK